MGGERRGDAPRNSPEWDSSCLGPLPAPPYHQTRPWKKRGGSSLSPESQIQVLRQHLKRVTWRKWALIWSICGNWVGSREGALHQNWRPWFFLHSVPIHSLPQDKPTPSLSCLSRLWSQWQNIGRMIVQREGGLSSVCKMLRTPLEPRAIRALSSPQTHFTGKEVEELSGGLKFGPN